MNENDIMYRINKEDTVYKGIVPRTTYNGKTMRITINVPDKVILRALGVALLLIQLHRSL